MSEALVIWTVYDRPTDYPEKIVVRAWLAVDPPQPTMDFFVCATLEEARDRLAGCGLTCLARDPNDDPKIVESWV